MERVQEMNLELIALNAELAQANRAQTERCRRLLGAVRLLGDVLEQAGEITTEDDGQEWVINSELYEQIAAYLADLHAVENGAMVSGMLQSMDNAIYKGVASGEN